MRVLMVCLGNICRSPTAEAVLRAKLEAAGLASSVSVDSAGTYGGHAGERQMLPRHTIRTRIAQLPPAPRAGSGTTLPSWSAAPKACSRSSASWSRTRAAFSNSRLRA